ncbi:MAG: hypothetical protein HYY16_11595 [Planctomycetes bacterium]|nr:hypothetical protein [Planctomycetota bacterium]
MRIWTDERGSRAACARLQRAEFEAIQHQESVGTGYFDDVLQAATGGRPPSAWRVPPGRRNSLAGLSSGATVSPEWKRCLRRSRRQNG